MPRFDLPEPVTLVVICMATLLSGVVNTATGVGGSAMLLPIALLFLTPQESLVVVAISQVTRNLYLTLLVYREAVWRVTWRLM
ncbi:MAG TPA: hypothetical protein VEI97_02655, partial [bacterium]|nr:hypothetical protein [bacterium]